MKVSVVICSRKQELSDELRANVATTIGCEYEWVVIDNSRNEYSIFQAYNDAVTRSTGDILCFMHDDIRFLSEGWGRSVISVLAPPSVGACAVAGCRVLRKAPSLFGMGKYNVINVQQADGTWLDRSSEPAFLATFDGLWFCIKRECFNKIRFDDVTYDGFHFYDMDTAVQLHRSGYQIVFIPDVLIQHESNGCVNASWLEDSYKYYWKNKDDLPIFVTDEHPDAEEMEQYEMDVIYTSLHLIWLFRRWHLLGQWRTMAAEVLQVRQLGVVFRVLWNHFKKKRS